MKHISIKILSIVYSHCYIKPQTAPAIKAPLPPFLQRIHPQVFIIHKDIINSVRYKYLIFYFFIITARQQKIYSALHLALTNNRHIIVTIFDRKIRLLIGFFCFNYPKTAFSAAIIANIYSHKLVILFDGNLFRYRT